MANAFDTTSPNGTILRRRPWTVLAVVLAAGFLFAVLSKGVNADTLGVDFGVFHAGGTLISDEGFDAAYDNDGFAEYLGTEYFPPLQNSNTVSHFISTPTFGWFAQGLTWLSFDASLLVWTLVGLAVVVPAVRMLGLPNWTLLVLLISPMMALNLRLGQTGTFVLLLFAALHLAVADGRLKHAGVLAGLIILKPPLALGYGLLWLIQARRYAESMIAAALTGLVISIPTLTGGLGPWRGFVDAMRERADAESEWSQQSASVPEFLKLLLPGSPSWVTLVAWALGLVAAALVILAAHRRFGDDAELMSVAAIVATIVASPHLLVYDSMILLIPAAVAYKRNLLTGDRAGMLAAIMTAGLTLSPELYNVQYAAIGRGIGLEFPALAVCVWLLVRWSEQAAVNDAPSVAVLTNA